MREKKCSVGSKIENTYLGQGNSLDYLRWQKR